jgi:hypothetical protein
LALITFVVEAGFLESAITVIPLFHSTPLMILPEIHFHY